MNRREFIKITGGITAIFTFPEVILAGTRVTVSKAAARASIIWLQGQSCSGDSVSLLNSEDPDIASLITNHVSLNFHQTISIATGDTAIDILLKTIKEQRKDYILVFEGSLPKKSQIFCTIGEVNNKPVGASEWLTLLAKNAKAVVACGTCAAYGCIPAAKVRSQQQNPTNSTSIWEFLKDTKIKKRINVPGCPAHPDWVIGTLIHLIMNKRIKLDEYGRPLIYFKKTVHDRCEHLEEYKKEIFANNWGEKGCLYKLGCLGIDTHCDIPMRKWLKVNSCTKCGGGCIGCTEPPFPDYGNRGIFPTTKA
jgi:hydrogenase small subunit